MVSQVSLASLNYFLPIFSFLFVFIMIYALLAKTKIIGDNQFVNLFLSFILAVFFILNVSLVEFVQFNLAWFVVFIICVFMIMLLISFSHGKLDVVMKPFVAWVLMIALITFFIISSAHIFKWTIDWVQIQSWMSTDWWGLVLVLIIAGIVSWRITKK
ncbi:MAG: hypothetical protein ACOYT4_03995 [Nanoarchaeota archaeon]